jgi:hypothetical protein
VCEGREELCFWSTTCLFPDFFPETPRVQKKRRTRVVDFINDDENGLRFVVAVSVSSRAS